MAVTNINDLTDVGTIADGDKLVGERVDGTAVRIVYQQQTNLSNCTNYPVAQLAGAGAGVLTWIATPSSANLAAAIIDESGASSLVFQNSPLINSPTLTGPILGTPLSGNLSNCTGYTLSNLSGLGSNVAAFLATPTSANLATAITDESGASSLIFQNSPLINSPTLTGPILGTPLSGNLSNCTAYPLAQLAGAAAGILTFLATPSSANLASALTDESGSSSVVFQNSPLINSPTLTGPALGTAISGVLSNCSGYPLSQITGAGTNVLAFLATPSSANLAAALTDETGSGAAVFATSPTLVTPALGVATGTSFNGITGIAAQSDQETGTSTALVVTPGRQKYHPVSTKCWARYDAAGGITATSGISAINDIGTGYARVNFTTSFSAATAYAAIVSVEASTGVEAVTVNGAFTTGYVDTACYTILGAAVDPTTWNLAAWGDL